MSRLKSSKKYKRCKKCKELVTDPENCANCADLNPLSLSRRNHCVDGKVSAPNLDTQEGNSEEYF